VKTWFQAFAFKCNLYRYAVPLLLIPDAGVAAEVNAAASQLRWTMGRVKANAFIARLGGATVTI
jgi:hypothetical protein